MRRAAPLVAAAIASCLFVAPVAIADAPPTAWDRARDPASGERYRLHVSVEELLWRARQPHNPLKNLLLERARAELEEAAAARSPDVRLRFDLGEIYFHLNRYDEALRVLQPALAIAPHQSAAAEAWVDLAFSAARLDRSSLELDAYDAYLSLALGAHPDVSILSNRAEAEMRLGDLDAAVAGYRDVIEQGEHVYGVEPQVLVLARWGLAVALDRDHDAAQAEHEAFLAAERDPEEQFIGDKDDVFFVPEYERDWYYALGRTQHARQATDPVRAYGCWSLVVETWGHYIASAARNDRWVGLARAHLADAEAQQRAAAARLGKVRPGKDKLLPTVRRRERPC